MDSTLSRLPAWLNSLVIWMQKGDKLGKYALYKAVNRYFSGSVVCYHTPLGLFLTPTEEWCFWQLGGPEHYYLDEFTPFLNLINDFDTDFSFFDLGADIGTVSALVASHCPLLRHVFAFEPNRGAFTLLQHNLGSCQCSVYAEHKAISDYEGKATLVTRSRSLGDHEGYISDKFKVESSENSNEIDVTSLDAYLSQSSQSLARLVVIKIDVEGQEVEAIKGAEKLIQHANQCILLIEIHPDVLQKREQTPEDIFLAVERVRPVNWLIPKCNNQLVDRSRPLFSQIDHGQYDIIATSHFPKP
jgi:FkbM family methyltransferase